jgi:integrase/recombinase XerD
MSRLAPTMEAFFTDRLIRERNSSPNTIAAYRDTMRLLLTFASEQLKVEPSRLEIGDLDAPLIGRSWTTSSRSAAAARAPAIRG